MEESHGEKVVFEGDLAIAITPEGTQRQMSVAEVIRHLAPNVPDTCGVVLPDGIKYAIAKRGGVMLVHQTPPQVYAFRWIANDSENEFGPGTKYRSVRLSLPYVIVLAGYANQRSGIPVLGDANECYFSNSPVELKGLDTPLAFPALLNCSKMSEDHGGGMPLSWICTQHLDKKETHGRKTVDAAYHDGLGALLRHLFESGFNRSSEHHEGASGFSASVEAKIDPRIASVEAWEEATNADPTFAVDVPWLPVGNTLGEITQRGARRGRRRGNGPTTAADVARIILNATAQPGTRATSKGSSS